MLRRLTRRLFGSYPSGEMLSPLDGRYEGKTKVLREYFSERAFMWFRVKVEVEWLKHLARQGAIALPKTMSVEQFSGKLEPLLSDKEFYNRVKEIESVTNHDIKAVEYYVKEKMKERAELAPLAEYVHFTCTSEDINNIAYALMTKAARDKVIYPAMDELYNALYSLAVRTKGAKMMGRTHGQPATPTTLGKEVANYCYRLHGLATKASDIPFAAKLNGAVGNFNAHLFVYPEIRWAEVSRTFIEGLGLEWAPFSTQIECHDSLCSYFSALHHFNTVLIGLSRDFWHYTSLGYLKQRAVKGEVGSSTMPHKVNPIDFENAEGNLGVANALLSHFSEKLPISRFQRDLSDSTVLRNIGSSFGYSLLSYASLQKGLGRVEANSNRMLEELEDHWELLAEPIQMLLRKEGDESPYEKLKELTRGAKVDQSSIHTFVKGLKARPEVEKRLLGLTPSTYTGMAEELVDWLPSSLSQPKRSSS